MTAQELIERLKRFPQDTPVLINDDDRFKSIDDTALSVSSLDDEDDSMASGVPLGTNVLVLWGK